MLLGVGGRFRFHLASYRLFYDKCMCEFQRLETSHGKWQMGREIAIEERFFLQTTKCG